VRGRGGLLAAEQEEDYAKNLGSASRERMTHSGFEERKFSCGDRAAGARFASRRQILAPKKAFAFSVEPPAAFPSQSTARGNQWRSKSVRFSNARTFPRGSEATVQNFQAVFRFEIGNLRASSAVAFTPSRVV
jgi:hypothetical protein